ncbi:hypothetical protein, partial [Acinetobacter pittii]|uniref:hypothetical protein n=1 Tax=Acinetobacter pittii TaxID=48296 RepID=UPI0025AF0810
EWVHVQLHQQKGMISLSPPTICNSAGKIAFSSAHVNLLLTAGIIIGILSIVVFFMLAKYRDENSL